jgi:GT2 family glycosyltransferase
VSVVIAVNRYMGPSWMDALVSQENVSYDVFIVDARLDDDYQPMIDHIVATAERPAPIHYTRLERGGRAMANNHGIEQSTGDVVLFLGDDQLALPGIVAAHARFHAEHPESTAVGIGPSVIREADETRFGLWLQATGLLYGARSDDEVAEVPEDFFNVSNASVKRSLLDAVGRFDERYLFHTWDDFEFGLRLRDAGMVARLVPHALTIHQHPITLRDRMPSMVESGMSAHLFERDHDGPHPWTPVVARAPRLHRLRAAVHLARYGLTRNEQALDRYYRRFQDAGFSAGYRQARRARASTAQGSPGALVGSARKQLAE